MRILLSKKSREKLFSFLKNENKVKTLKELSEKTKIPFKTLQKWKLGNLYIPEKFIPKNFKDFKIITEKPNNWGQINGGKIGGKKSSERLRKKYGEIKYSIIMSQRGKKSINTLWEKFGKEKVIKMVREGKINRRINQIKKLEEENKNYFLNKEIYFNNSSINFSK